MVIGAGERELRAVGYEAHRPNAHWIGGRQGRQFLAVCRLMQFDRPAVGEGRNKLSISTKNPADKPFLVWHFLPRTDVPHLHLPPCTAGKQVLAAWGEEAPAAVDGGDILHELTAASIPNL